MTLETGHRLGPYEIVAPIGAGGMGEVYEAKDTRLGRTVAIKVLPEGLAENPERRARFERESRTVSQLSHPHICTLHDVGEEEGIHFLVMEHLEGETLAERLGRGALPLEETLRFGAQIAEALDAAHRRGVIHRDLKPANVMLTSSGVKLLDFGLARILAGAAEEVADLPTMTMRDEGALTDEGTVLGTYPYMSPEQVEGAEADARSDIFALGAVLYEMATGKRAFDGDSAASVMAAVLREEPEPITKIQPVSPPALDHVVSRCLAKDPERRWQTARDVAEELRWIREAGSQAGVAAPVAKRRKSRERLAWGVAGLLGTLLLLGATWYVFTTGSRPHRSVVSFSLSPPEDTIYNEIPALSPDGRLLAFVAQEDEQKQLWLRPLASLEAHPLPGTEGAIQPFWSPDSDSLGFFADGELKRLDLDSGTVRTLAEARLTWGGSWSSQGYILFVDQLSGLLRIPESGGVPNPVEPFDETEARLYFWPHLLPDGQRFLFSTFLHGQGGGLYLGSVEDRSPRLLRPATDLSSISRTEFDPTGFLLFIGRGGRSGGSSPLLAQRFDADREELVGEPFQVAEQVYTTDPGQARFSLGPDGLLVIRAERNQELRQFGWLGRSGEIGTTVGPASLWRSVDLSPDDSTIAAVRGQETGGWALWVLDARRGTPTRLASDSSSPVWSWDGRRLAFAMVEDGPPNPFVIDLAAGDAPRRVAPFPLAAQPTAWSADDQWLVVESPGEDGGLFLTSLESGDSEPLLPGEPRERKGAVSPDGEWLAFASEESGSWEIYVTRFPDGGRRWRVSTDGGWDVRWTGDGEALVYSDGERILRVPVESDGDLRPGDPVEVYADQNLVAWDVASDGRLLVLLRTGELIRPPLVVVTDWREMAGVPYEP